MKRLFLSAFAAVALSGCGLLDLAHAQSTALGIGLPPTSLPQRVTVDEKLGISVETAYQAANLAVRVAIRAGLVNASQARRLAELDNQAYTYVCYTRTAYDIANGNSPARRRDKCPVSTKTGRIPAYADAARAALTVLREIVGTLTAYKVAAQQDFTTIPPAPSYIT